MEVLIVLKVHAKALTKALIAAEISTATELASKAGIAHATAKKAMNGGLVSVKSSHKIYRAVAAYSGEYEELFSPQRREVDDDTVRRYDKEAVS